MLDLIKETLNFEANKGLLISSPIGVKWTIELDKKQSLKMLRELTELVEKIPEIKECGILNSKK